MEGFAWKSRSFFNGLAILISIATVLHQSSGCQDSPVGIADSSIIPDDRFTASSEYDSRYAPKNARLNGATGGGWGPRTNGANDYLQIDLGQVFVICAVATQGARTIDEWTKQYKIATSLDNSTWSTYKNGSVDKVFIGNTDKTTVVKNALHYQVLLRYIRFIPTTYNRHKVLRVEAYGLPRGILCSSIPVGIGSGKIPGSDMTSSSSYNSTTSPSKARLNSTAGSSWCAATSDSSPYLQINLGSPYIICGIATQGDHVTDQWVQSYHVLTSNDGATFTDYMENSQTRSFAGNFDSSTAVKDVLYDGTVSQYIRVSPTSHYGKTNCMKTELYGIQHDRGCTSIPFGISYPSIIPDHRFTASSYYDERYIPNNARLRVPKAWAPKTASGGDWLQIDLGSVVFVCAVATQGSGYDSQEWVKSYKIKVSLDNVNWNYYQENRVDKTFTANTNKNGVVTNSLARPIEARFLRFYPLTSQSHPTMRTEVYGTKTACSPPVGLEVPGIIQSSRMTSSSQLNNTHTASHGRLYGNSSWCSNTSSNTEYIQINLGQVMTVTGIATQGDQTMDQWVTTYIISYSMDGNLWNTYKDGGNTHKIFQGNSDRQIVRVQWLSHPVTARHIRVKPQAWNTAICMRIELYGCDYATRPVISGLTNQNLPLASNSYVDLVCMVQEPLIQSIKWYTGNTDITSQSTGLVRGANGVKQSTLRVNYTSDAHVLNTYECFKHSWESCYKSFICRALYGGTLTNADGLKSAWVKVGVAPSSPRNLRARQIPPTVNTRPQVQLTWDIPTYPNGRIREYVVYYGLLEKHSEFTKETVDRTITSLNIAVFGGKTYWFRVAGKILKEGSYTPKLQVSTDIHKPSDSPRALSASKRDSSTFVISWQPLPLEKANGPIIKYEIEWSKITSSNPTTISRKMVNSSLSEATIENLEECSQYNVSIRGYTTAGPGPFTKPPVTISTSAPGAPTHLAVIPGTVEKREVVLRWKKKAVLEPVLKYAITFRGTKIYNNSFLHSEERVSTHPSEKFKVDNLYPDTTYEFQVSAITRCGRGEKSSSVMATTKIAAPPAPLVPDSSIVNITSSTVKIKLWPVSNINGKIRKYEVIVKELVSSPAFDATRLTDRKTATREGLPYYIAEETNDVTKPVNVNLDENKMYEIEERALTGSEVSNQEGTKEWQYFHGPMSVVARSYRSRDEGGGRSDLVSSKVGSATLYGTLAVIGAMALMIIPLLVWICRLRNQNKIMKACERISSRSKTTDQFENAVAMQDRPYTNDTRGPGHPLPIITEDEYEELNNQEQIGDTKEQKTRTATILEANHEASPSVPIDDELYAEVNEPVVTGERNQQIDKGIKTTLSDSAADDHECDYEDMNPGPNEDEDEDEHEHEEGTDYVNSMLYADPECQANYQPLNPAIDSEYKRLHDYKNSGYEGEEEDESFT